MFEDMTKEKILSDLLSQAPADIDTRPGSIYYDAVKGTALVIARMYSDLSIITNLIYIDSTGGEYLDKKYAARGGQQLYSCCRSSRRILEQYRERNACISCQYD